MPNMAKGLFLAPLVLTCVLAPVVSGAEIGKLTLHAKCHDW